MSSNLPNPNSLTLELASLQPLACSVDEKCDGLGDPDLENTRDTEKFGEGGESQTEQSQTQTGEITDPNLVGPTYSFFVLCYVFIHGKFQSIGTVNIDLLISLC